ncbi:MAG: type II toxin-antitoxin system PemK/MazF family toxin [Bradyrhizobium sp.]
MRRGEIWTLAGGPDYAGKPRPIVIIQDDAFFETQSVTICPFTSNSTLAPAVRIEVEPTESNGLRLVSQIMVDKITTTHRSKLGKRIGRLPETDIVRLDRSILAFLGLA